MQEEVRRLHGAACRRTQKSGQVLFIKAAHLIG
jgi:LDH2 family malate/lactate/ureidoglycolate dehydrogenase